MLLPSPEMRTKKDPSVAMINLLAQMKGNSVEQAMNQKREQWLAIVQAAATNGLDGFTMTTAQGNQWAVITGDTRFPGFFRYTLFDRKGFFGHGSYRTAEAAVEAAFDMGYRFSDSSTRLDEIAANCWGFH